MSVLSQSSCLGQLETVLGKDVLELQRFNGQEAMSALFTFHVDCLAITPDIDFDALIGTHASVILNTRTGERAFDGIFTEARWLGAGKNGLAYQLTLRPWFFSASLRRNQRIFHNKTVVQILDELLGSYADAGTHTAQLTADYPTLEYTVQFRESDFAFACRMMERQGISWHFRHRAGHHDMLLTDIAESHASIGARPFHPDEGHHQEDIDHFWNWHPARRITTGAIKLTDYNFKTPHAAMKADSTGDAAYAQGQIESFDWPGGYLDQKRGRAVASLRTDGARGQDRRFQAMGDVADLGAGLRVTLSGDPVPGTGDNYLCLSATHTYASNGYGSGGKQDDEMAYRGLFMLIPASAPMRPELKTPLADVRGPQTAVVVGEGEIDCDEYGRILVRFHWDLDNAFSMRCRVSQNWAGNNWGGMIIPRIGMEVVVEFLDGDPDQPLVTGCVYNARNMPPYPLPENKTVSTFKSNTHKGRGYNEFRFEDEAGREEVWMHAQKDHNTVILNDESHAIGHDVRQTVGNDVFLTVGRNQQESYGKDHVENVGNILKQAIFADQFYEVGGKYQGQVAGSYKLDVGSSITTNTGKHVLMAFEKFTIAGPGGKITIDASGITLEAARIDLKGAVTMGGSGSAQVPTLALAANQGLPLCEECPKSAQD